MPASRAYFSIAVPALFVNINKGTRGMSTFNSRAASSPFMTGMERSRMIRSGFSACAFRTPSPVRCIGHDQAFRFQHCTHHPPDDRVIVDDHHNKIGHFYTRPRHTISLFVRKGNTVEAVRLRNTTRTAIGPPMSASLASIG